MALQISDMQIWVSGGATNDDPLDSLGGVMSTEDPGGLVLSQAASAPTNVTGVTITNAYGNAIGLGTIKWDAVTFRLSWKPFGGVSFNGAEVLADGTFVIGGSNGYLICDVDFSALPGSTQQDVDIAITNRMHNTFDAVSALESMDGLIEYRCFYILNSSAADTAYDVRIWVKEQPVGMDELDLCLDPAGKGDGATTGVAIGPLVDEEDSTNLLSALSFTRPTTQATGLLLGNLSPGEAYAFWERRDVPVATNEQVSNDTSKIGISVLG